MTSDEEEGEADASTWGELDPDEQRAQVRVEETIRAYIAERSDEEDATYSELLEGWLPAEGKVPTTGEVKALKVTPTVHNRVKALTKGWFRQGEIVAYYAMLDAIERGDDKRAAALAPHAATAVVADVTETLDEDDDDE